MKRSNILHLAAALFAFVAFSCVPARKFKELQNDATNCENVRQSLRIENEKLSVENNELKDKLSRCNRSIDSLRYDSIKLVSEKENCMKENARLQGINNDMQDAQNSLLRNNSRETTKLLKQLQTTQTELQKKEDSLRIIGNSLMLKQKDLEGKDEAMNEKERNIKQLNNELNARDARIKKLEAIMARNDSAVKALRNKVNQALTGFESKDLTVNIKNGKVYVSLEEKLLFKSGSYDIDPKGQEALKKLAVVLEQNPDINVLIEGHTDDVPLRGTTAIKDNWDLSVMRATTVVKGILKSGKIDAKRLTAAGRGEFFPLDPSKTAEARQKNRRTEIILTPKLDELFRILGSN